MDEPTSQLDSTGRDEVLEVLERVNSERGTNVVVVTHDPEVGTRMGRLVTIRDGRVGAEGRGGLEFAVLAGDGTVQRLPAGHPLHGRARRGRVRLVAELPTGAPRPAGAPGSGGE